jgi:hypothetical protein
MVSAMAQTPLPMSNPRPIMAFEKIFINFLLRTG